MRDAPDDGAAGTSSDVTVFAPSPTLTVTVEDNPAGSEIHVHAGGQGVWQARMLRRLGVSVTMCCGLTGETGAVLRHLLRDEGVRVVAVERGGRGSAYLHDRRGGRRVAVAEEEGDPLGRHELDELYGAMLRESASSGVAVLSGPAGDDALPADTYRRLAADLSEGGVRVVVDLAGARMAAALAGGVDLLKVSDEELRVDGIVQGTSMRELRAAMRSLRARGAGTVVVSRAQEPLLLLDGEGFMEVVNPRLETADARGAGDSLVAGLVAGIVRGESARRAITLGAAAGALNVTRHGLGTGDGETIARLRGSIRTRPLADDPVDAEGLGVSSGVVTPDGLAALARPEERQP